MAKDIFERLNAGRPPQEPAPPPSPWRREGCSTGSNATGPSPPSARETTTLRA